ncbi:hypothetical protein Pan241w_26130 [Gimesia alba]|uniref:Uncharacterized protein n=1 Tax=Gimesia alba TaxID=2527973 RepID=A0A517RF74_9PLAN|nr:hypothetical protein Pan241w_26130 [Gimesia alba]
MASLKTVTLNSVCSLNGPVIAIHPAELVSETIRANKYPAFQTICCTVQRSAFTFQHGEN